VNGKNKSLNEEQFIYHRMSKGITFKQAKKEFDENHKEGMWDKLNKLIKTNGAIVLFGSEPFSSALRMSNIKNYKYDWIWIKNQATNHLHAKRMPMRKTENISVFFKGASSYNPQKTEGHIPTNSAKGCSNGVIYHGRNIRNYEGGDTSRMPQNILNFNCVNNYSKVHPNEKPIKLLEYLIKTYTNENETVLDFTMGSGTTGVAAKNTNRNFIGIELDTEYFKIAEKRINEAQTQTKLHL
jgi:site-specific DNA-methyltransferase (adenine-specific)